MYPKPAKTVARLTGSRFRFAGFSRMRLTATTDTAAAIIELAYTAAGPRKIA